MSICDLARPEIRTLQPYQAAIQLHDAIRLNANEAPWRNDADSFLRPLNRYPEVRPAQLRNLLANHYGCDPGGLLVTRGTSEAIDLLMRVFCRPGVDNIVTTSPTFSMYAHYAVVQGAGLREVVTSGDDDFALNPTDLLAACDARSKLIFLCSPNNPTGNLLPRADLLRILDARDDRSVIVVDEAYIEFADAPSAIELLEGYENLVVLRTLSKALAFAGARCGSVIATRNIIDMINAIQAPYAVATPVVECVEAAFSANTPARAGQHVMQTVAERERLARMLQGYRFVSRVWPSAGNFLLVRVDDAEALMKHCAGDRLLLRFFGGELGDCVRITIGSTAENDCLIASLDRLETVHG